MAKLDARPSIVNIDAYQGDQFELTVNVVDPAGDPFDLTDYDARMTIRQHIADLAPTITAETEGTTATPASGVVVFSFDGDVMQPLRGSYTYDAEVYPSGNLSGRRTVVAGMLDVAGDVTQPAVVL